LRVGATQQRHVVESSDAQVAVGGRSGESRRGIELVRAVGADDIGARGTRQVDVVALEVGHSTSTHANVARGAKGEVTERVKVHHLGRGLEIATSKVDEIAREHVNAIGTAINTTNIID